MRRCCGALGPTPACPPGRARLSCRPLPHGAGSANVLHTPGGVRCPPRRAATAGTSASSTTPNNTSVTVLGAGVIGWAAALAVARTRGVASTTLVAADFDDTTSHGAGGLWEPYKCGATPPDLINRWGGATLDHLRALYASREAGPAGVTELAVFQLWSAGGPSPSPPDPTWAAVVPHFRRLTRAELDGWEAASEATPGPRAAYSAGWTFWSAVAQPSRYVPWLADRARRAGVRTATARVSCLEDVAALTPGRRPSVIVNCAGLGAAGLLPDASLTPVRGQVARLDAPWVKSSVFVDENTYVIPNNDFCVVGGTAQEGDGDAVPRPADRDSILQRAVRAVPGLVGAAHRGDWAGLRPVRPSVRLELDRDAASVPVVHCYGHGGSGVTLHWGCAADVAELVRRVIEA